MTDSLKEMVERVSWFKPVDYEILQFYEENDIMATGNVVSKNIGYDRQYVNKRLVKMADAGLFDHEDGFYFLSDYGHQFLVGKIDPRELED